MWADRFISFQERLLISDTKVSCLQGLWIR